MCVNINNLNENNLLILHSWANRSYNSTDIVLAAFHDRVYSLCLGEGCGAQVLVAHHCLQPQVTHQALDIRVGWITSAPARCRRGGRHINQTTAIEALRREAADFRVHPIPWQRCYEIRQKSLSHPKKMAEEGISSSSNLGWKRNKREKQQHRLDRTWWTAAWTITRDHVFAELDVQSFQQCQFETDFTIDIRGAAETTLWTWKKSKSQATVPAAWCSPAASRSRIFPCRNQRHEMTWRGCSPNSWTYSMWILHTNKINNCAQTWQWKIPCMKSPIDDFLNFKPPFMWWNSRSAMCDDSEG